MGAEFSQKNQKTAGRTPQQGLQVDTTGVGGHVPVQLCGPEVLHAPMAWRCRGWWWSLVGDGPFRDECWKGLGLSKPESFDCGYTGSLWQ